MVEPVAVGLMKPSPQASQRDGLISETSNTEAAPSPGGEETRGAKCSLASVPCRAARN